MEVTAGLVAGSHNHNELVVIFRRDEESASAPDPLQQHNKQICQICGDEVGLTANRELFVGCNECAFPVCRTCYEYERQEGGQVCPQCKTRYRRLKGCARVEGDEEDDEMDDGEYEDDDGNNLRQQALVPSSRETGLGGSKNVHQSYLANYNVLGQTRVSESTSKDLAVYDDGDLAWKERIENWKQKQEIEKMLKGKGGATLFEDSDAVDMLLMNEARQPLTRKLSIPSSQINPYRLIIIFRCILLGFFFHYRITHPVKDTLSLWLVSVVCEIWFALSWILDQFPKWHPVDRETYLDRLSLRYEKEGQPSQLSPVDIFISTVDPLKEPPLVTANTVLSILSVDYPVDKLSCYVSDESASMLTFETLSETLKFSKKWVPFCKKFYIEPRAPELYFADKLDYTRDKVLPTFLRERKLLKREYEEFKVRINALVAKARKIPEEGCMMQDGTPWPGNNIRDHPGMLQVLHGQNGHCDTDGNELPRLLYVSREKRPGFNHHKRAGAMNALVSNGLINPSRSSHKLFSTFPNSSWPSELQLRVSAVFTNAPYVLNVECDHYINNSKALREAMCFVMEPILGKRVCYVKFPQRYDRIDANVQYAKRSTEFFDINMRGLDGIQGPLYIGSGCVVRRLALYGHDAPRNLKRPTKACNCLPKWCFCPCCLSRMKRKSKKLKCRMTPKLSSKTHGGSSIGEFDVSEVGIEAEVPGNGHLALLAGYKLEKKFGLSPVFIASTLLEDGGRTISASSSSLIKEAIHVISCQYEEKTDWGKEVGWIYGSVTEDILTGFKMHCHGWKSIYCIPPRPAFKGSPHNNLLDHLHQVLRWALGSLEILLSKHCPLWYGYDGGLKWLQRLSYINATVYPLTALPLVIYCILPAVCLLKGDFIIPELSNAASLWFVSLFICIFASTVLEMRWSGVGIDDWWRNEQFWVIGGVSAHLFAIFQGLFKVFTGVDELSDKYALRWTVLLIPPTTILIVNIIGVVVGISNGIKHGSGSWGPLLGKLFFAFWVIAHLYPFLKGLVGRHNRTPTIVVVWSILIAAIFSLLWTRVDPLSEGSSGVFLEDCGLDCR